MMRALGRAWLLPLAALPALTGCVTGPTGGNRLEAPIALEVPRAGVEPLRVTAVVVIPSEEREFKAWAPALGGAWDFHWGRNLPAAAHSAFSQVFSSVTVTDAPQDADYEVRLTFDRAKTSARMSLISMSSSLAVVVQLFEGRERLWERVFETRRKLGGTGDPGELGLQLSMVLRDAAKAVHATASGRPLVARAAPAPAPEPLRESRAPSAIAAAPRSDVDEVPAARAPLTKRHALVIGVETYRENLPKAQYASADAKLVAEYARRVLGVPEENVAVLTDGHATRGDFEKYFERWLPNRVEAGDEVLVYFSGHGAPNSKTGDAFLVPYDGDPTYIDQTGYPLKKLYAQLAKLPAKKVTVVLDSCFSGAGGRSVIAKGARPLVAVQTEAVPAKLTVVSASAGDQVSNSYDEKGHGLFTYFFLKGLKEKGADLKVVFDYLKPEVTRVARRQFNSDQEPQWREGR